MEKAKVFVIMPFSDEFFESYEMMKAHFEEKFEFSHAGDEDNQQNILADYNFSKPNQNVQYYPYYILLFSYFLEVNPKES